MSLPGEQLRKVWRNDIKQVSSFLNQFHTNHYLIMNVSEFNYNYQLFNNQVIHKEFPDHHSPPLIILLEIIRIIDDFLSSHERNVVIVHCMAGKGRTGCVIAALLLHFNYQITTEGALQEFALKRTVNGVGCRVPSQIRYVYYFSYLHQANTDRAISLSLAFQFAQNPLRLILDGIKFHSFPLLEKHNPIFSTTLRVKVVQAAIKLPFKVILPIDKLFSSSTKLLETCILPINSRISGDIMIKFWHRASSRSNYADLMKAIPSKGLFEEINRYPKIALFRFTFHTSFVKSINLTDPDFKNSSFVFDLSYNELDSFFSGPLKCKLIPDAFRLSVFFFN
eukprot:TRINITY_DN1036_c4_g1_i2.p1 TRINITY_DN1036_c4_g1~~TRINITY_DN1036_c4_g1_i2.p1  ORF type:complete len:337 (+),score=90.67 TRINITY_DN1036_c4_g1_i2:160-1170(+)